MKDSKGKKRFNAITAKALAISILAGFLFCGCEQKDLCYDHNHASDVEVTFDWKNDTCANPSSMMTFFFPRKADERMLKREFIGKGGGMAQVLVGVGYGALCFNSDTRNIQYRTIGESGSVIVSLKDAGTIDRIGVAANSLPRAKGSEEERMAMEADSLWSATSEKDILVSLDEHDRGDVHHLTLCPQRRYCSYHIRFLSIENQKYISSSLAGSLSGLAGGVSLSTGEKTEERVTVPFSLKIMDDNSLKGTMCCLGDCAESEAPNKLVIYTILKDGTKWSYVFDVTDQVRKAPDPYDVEIVIDKLPIPSKIDGNSGFTPGVSDWEVIEIPIKM